MNKDSEDLKRRRSGPAKLGKVLYKIKKELSPAAFTIESELTFLWSEVVGDEIADTLSFIKLAKNNDKTHTLVCGVKSSALATKFHFMQNSIIQKVNTFFGFGLVSALTIRHIVAEAKVKPSKKQPVPLTSKEQSALSSEVGELENEELKTALLNLGGSVIVSNKK